MELHILDMCDPERDSGQSPEPPKQLLLQDASKLQVISYR